MESIAGVRLPAGYNGVGMHDSPGAWAGNMSYNEARNHAEELKRHGVTAYKLFTEGLKVERARAYVDAGLLVACRWWEGMGTWGRPPDEWITKPDKIKQMIDVGVQLVEPGDNEFNIQDEWSIPIPHARGIAVAVVNAWEVILNRVAVVPGAIPLFPSNTPGGHVDHRLCYIEIVEELIRRGLTGTVEHVAVHNRPLNNPPPIKWTAINTCTFDEWRWIRDRFKSGGMYPYFWATEHGYSLGVGDNHDYPPIDLVRHTDYNWELSMRMNPDHQYATESEFAGFFHWFHACYGHCGSWPKDSLTDAPHTMPSPSPLWARMGQHPEHLSFERQPKLQGPDSKPKAYPIYDMTARRRCWPEGQSPEVRPQSQIRQLVIHHLGAGERTHSDERRFLRRMCCSMDKKLYGYHWVIDGRGGIWIVNNRHHAVYHAGNRDVNRTSVAVSMMGNNWESDPTVEQVEALCYLTWLLKLPYIPHKDIVATKCPGDLRRGWWGKYKACVAKYGGGPVHAS